MNIDGMGEKIIVRLYEEGKINSYVDLYKLTYDDLIGLEGFQEKSVMNTLESIKESLNQELENFIFALGIRNVGLGSAKLILKKFNSIEKIKNASIEELISVDGVGLVIAESLCDFLDDAVNYQQIIQMGEYGLKLEKEIAEIIQYSEQVAVHKTQKILCLLIMLP